MAYHIEPATVEPESPQHASAATAVEETAEVLAIDAPPVDDVHPDEEGDG